ncbi:hypothetical protein P7K49_012752 [Saguinus oedipus]|uniref:Uncharacterized protein n=1 Tax=Saguinus oedipus TaxID=9490 RepID=A0ABQ9VGW9_SAGOE|nr:hypothetical protein P7K49_012752 [Saguinus oedipus]
MDRIVDHGNPVTETTFCQRNYVVEKKRKTLYAFPYIKIKEFKEKKNPRSSSLPKPQSHAQAPLPCPSTLAHPEAQAWDHVRGGRRGGAQSRDHQAPLAPPPTSLSFPAAGAQPGIQAAFPNTEPRL